jgi:hypothetical protein
MDMGNFRRSWEKGRPARDDRAVHRKGWAEGAILHKDYKHMFD